MEPLDYLKVVARRWKVVLATLLLTTAGAFASTPAAQPDAPSGLVRYTATATVLMAPEAPQGLATTKLYMQRGELPQQIAEALGDGESGPELASRVTIEIDETIGMLTVSSTGADADEVERQVNTYTDRSIAYFDARLREESDRQVAGLRPMVERAATQLADLDDALAADPSDPVLAAQRTATANQYQSLLADMQAAAQGATRSAGLSVLERGTALSQGAATFAPPTSRSQRTLLGLAVGGLLGACLALVVDRLDNRVRTRQQVQEVAGTPVLAEVPQLSRSARRRAVPPVLCEPGGAFAESHRALRSSLSLMPARPIGGPPREVDRERVNRVVLVVSGSAGEGKSTTVVNLAATVASSGRSVVVVDADLRQPTLAGALGTAGGPGLADLASTEMREDATALAGVLLPTRVPGVRLLDAGTPERLTSLNPARMVGVVGRLRDVADVVLVDVAPLLGSSDVLDLVSAVDCALVVVRCGRTTTDQLRHTREVLERTRVPVLGTVLVGVARSASRIGTGSDGGGRSWISHRRSAAGRELVPNPASLDDHPTRDAWEGDR